jgi:PAS domain S-box-containing protein
VEAHIGRTVAEVLPEAAPFLGALLTQVFQSGRAIEGLEFEAPSPDAAGVVRWWLLSLFPLPGDDGRVELVGATAVEITGRKRAELSLAEAQARLDLATQAAGVGVWEWRPIPNEMIYSEEAKAICGFPPGGPVTYEMVIGVTHPEDLPNTSAQARRALDPAIRDESPYEYRLVRPDGEVRWVVAWGRAVFEQVDGRLVATRYIGVLQDITERKRAELEAGEAATRLRLAIEAGRMAVWQADETGVSSSPELNRLLGFAPDARPSLEDIAAGYLPGERERVRAAGAEAMARGERFFEAEYQYRRPGGAVVWLALRAEILPGSRSAVGVLMDITERKHAEERLRLLAHEVDHRANNLLAVVQGLVAMSRSETPEELKRMITGRVHALARAHQLLAETRWEGADLRRLVEEELLAFSLGHDGRVRLSGPELMLPAPVAQSLAMVLHELATNAAKYGALSTDGGTVSVSWRADPRLQIVWEERGGPAVAPPTRAGMGSSVLARALTAHHGAASLDWRADGLACTIELPLA